MNFATKSLSERLQKLGCVSDGGFWYMKLEDGYEERAYYAPDGADRAARCLRAFLPQDFIGPTERARENTDIIFNMGDWMADPLKHGYLCSSALRRELADSKTEAEFWSLIEYAIKEAT